MKIEQHLGTPALYDGWGHQPRAAQAGSGTVKEDPPSENAFEREPTPSEKYALQLRPPLRPRSHFIIAFANEIESMLAQPMPWSRSRKTSATRAYVAQQLESLPGAEHAAVRQKARSAFGRMANNIQGRTQPSHGSLPYDLSSALRDEIRRL